SCTVSGDCLSEVCAEDLCTVTSCANDDLDDGETDVDCGGVCPACDDDLNCELDADCQSGHCAAGLCAPPNCEDYRKNGDESDVDCGGSCPRCPTAVACTTHADCASSVCGGPAPLPNACLAPTCRDRVVNGDETDVDCGGSECGPCGLWQTCRDASDCQGSICAGSRCDAP
ncbi:MAG TPA: hypothetical protein VI197_32390, partial [Polyangiaceae bacterium]